jgi:hypothetical protein
MLPMVSQDSLFLIQCAEECDIYDLCGGSVAAPCGCIWRGEKHFKCEECPYVCIERRSVGFSLEGQILEGADLQSIRIKQPSNFAYPLFIPLATDEVGQSLQVPWVGADMKFLLTNPVSRGRAASPTTKLNSRVDVKQYLNAGASTQLMAILNGTDDRLERLWGMNEAGRRNFFALLRRRGFQIVTAPTFSVTDETSGFPASHNVLMLRRHHRVLREIHEAGLVAVPNLYWRAEQDRQELVAWINYNDVFAVSLDFSRSKPSSSFSQRLEDLLKVLRGLNRPVHVFLVGVGLVNRPPAKVMRRRVQSCEGQRSVWNADRSADVGCGNTL